MGVKINSINGENINYELIPENVYKSDILAARQEKEQNSTNGYNKSRSMRKIGQIPWSVMYNYALSKGIIPEKINEYYSSNNGKNIISLLKEFPMFKTVENL